MPRSFLVFIVLLIPVVLHAQRGRFGVSPPVIYPSQNVITIESPDGLDRVRVLGSTANVTVAGEGDLDCPTRHELEVFVSTAHLHAEVVLELTDCRGNAEMRRLVINTTWRVDTKRIGPVRAGSTPCAMFQIVLDPGAAPAILDSVSVADPRARLRFFSDLPHRLPTGHTYQYQVCFTTDEPGTYKIPVVTWMRRQYASGGYTTYPVADTGIVIVRLPPEEEPEVAADPTTFRSVAVPNAVIPPAGRFFAGAYDVLGVIAGYSISDNLMIFGGGAIPLPDDWGGVRGQMQGAASIGAKAGLTITEGLDVAVGYQYALSIYDEEATPDVRESQISVHAPWGAISYGDDDSRASLTLGYALKHHTKPLIEFDENALIVAAGGDYRFANHWKVAGEIAYMQTLGVVPIVATARYFTDTYAIDAGIGFAGITVGDGVAPAIPVLPVISAIFVF
ncbi:MAG TPA: hypothetical protein VNA88_13020 [Candidatus Kapabacteria bacterium]|nr:hypothetical protein [Candidatus Kapabacteria bacterium]